MAIHNWDEDMSSDENPEFAAAVQKEIDAWIAENPDNNPRCLKVTLRYNYWEDTHCKGKNRIVCTLGATALIQDDEDEYDLEMEAPIPDDGEEYEFDIHA